MKKLTTKEAVKHFSTRLSLVKDNVKQKEPLKKNQYFCLMVTSTTGETWYYEKNYPNAVLNSILEHDCIDIGLERTGKEIYLSKDFNRRREPFRGRTLIVETDITDIKDHFCIL